jgi:hypothetical protein
MYPNFKYLCYVYTFLLSSYMLCYVIVSQFGLMMEDRIKQWLFSLTCHTIREK